MSRAYACLGETYHLHFWQNDWGRLCAIVVTWGWKRPADRKCEPWTRIEWGTLAVWQLSLFSVRLRTLLTTSCCILISPHWILAVFTCFAFVITNCCVHTVCPSDCFLLCSLALPFWLLLAVFTCFTFLIASCCVHMFRLSDCFLLCSHVSPFWLLLVVFQPWYNPSWLTGLKTPIN